MLLVKNLSAGYGGADVIRDINLSVSHGELLCIVGPNGCGKSTLLKTLLKLLPFRGDVFIEGLALPALSRKALAKKAAFLGQSQELYFPYSVRTTVSLGRYAFANGIFHSLSKTDEEIINSVIEQLGLGGFENRSIAELSGGQLQRVFLARALAQTPRLILLDEPTNHLDLKYQLELLCFLKQWVRENKTTALVVLHDLNLVQNFADTALVMRSGLIAAHGKPHDVLSESVLRDVYETDVHRFMLDSLSHWQNTGA
ncbi:MAG: ABC transporter ATP-binding protein [Spirochaetaceae bacterium]|jgi:iron complex transport system ATP-binding protein|nr:ABC transporter ATP-binding protein [Spirochaetaceae bacterium]